MECCKKNLRQINNLPILNSAKVYNLFDMAGSLRDDILYLNRFRYFYFATMKLKC